MSHSRYLERLENGELKITSILNPDKDGFFDLTLENKGIIREAIAPANTLKEAHDKIFQILNKISETAIDDIEHEWKYIDAVSHLFVPDIIEGFREDVRKFGCDPGWVTDRIDDWLRSKYKLGEVISEGFDFNNGNPGRGIIQILDD